jgi:hypothetical protein
MAIEKHKIRRTEEEMRTLMPIKRKKKKMIEV